MINTIKHLCYKLKITKEELDHILAHSDYYYYQFQSIKTKYGGPQKDSNGIKKVRLLYPSRGKLKAVQENIHKNILSQLLMPEYAYGSIRGRNNILNAKRHIGNRYFFNADLKSFFPSINKDMVYKTFMSYGFSPDVSSVLTRLTTYKGVLPQGTPTSPLLSNLVFVPTADKIVGLLKPYNITFTTFLDDLTLSSTSNFKHIVPEILKIIQEDKYWLSHKKISYKTKDPEVTGIHIAGNRLLPHSEILEKQKESNNKMLNQYVNQIMSTSKA